MWSTAEVSRCSGVKESQINYTNYELEIAGPVEVLQRHIEEGHDAMLAARIGMLRRAGSRQEQPAPLSRERPETREIETQTDKTANTVNTRPNETQTDPCTKSTENTTENASDEVLQLQKTRQNNPSTSESVASDIGMPGPSNRNGEIKAIPMAAEQPKLAQEAAAAPSGLQANAVAENVNAERVAIPCDSPVIELPNRDAEGRQRLIIIHQRRHDEEGNAVSRNR